MATRNNKKAYIVWSDDLMIIDTLQVISTHPSLDLLRLNFFSMKELLYYVTKELEKRVENGSLYSTVGTKHMARYFRTLYKWEKRMYKEQQI